MKRGFLVFLALSAVFVPLLLSCVGAESSTTYTLTFNSGGGSAVASQSVESGGKASRPEDPQRAGHSLVNWYVDDSFQTVYDFEQSVTESITLYAAWHHELKSVIESGTVPSDLSPYGSLVQTVLEPYAAGAAIVARYVSSQGSGDASSWANAAGDVKTTMDSITDAGASKIYLVLLASGTHIPTDTLAMKNHVAIVGGWNEWEHTDTSTISGDNARRVFRNSGIDRTALLYGVTIANGTSSGIGGSGMYNLNSSPTLSHVTFTGNAAAYGDGGGMYNSNSSPTLSHVTFTGNTTSINGGGMSNLSSSPTLSHVTFSGNTAAISGGGMYNDNSSSPTLSHVTFSDNTATGVGGVGGGGMFNGNSSSPTLSHVTFSGNAASSIGGGMYNNKSSPTLSHVTFSSNTGNYGGGMYNYDNSSPTLNHVTFSGNTATNSGGGMFNGNSSSPTLSHVTFSGNTATGDGGGMYNSHSSPTLRHVTFSGNTAAIRGGGMYNNTNGASGHTIVNSLFWNNKGGANPTTNGQQIYVFNDTSGGAENMTITFSLVQHGIAETSGVTSDNNANDGLGIGGGTDSVTVTQANIIINDPKLAANLADNGGFVQTIALLDGSAAIDKGVYVRRSGTVGSFTFYYSEDSTNWFTDLTISSSASETLPGDIDLTATDARGYTRTGRPDIGAYEYGGTAL